jgi:hypothetical protein
MQSKSCKRIATLILLAVTAVGLLLLSLELVEGTPKVEAHAPAAGGLFIMAGRFRAL